MPHFKCSVKYFDAMWLITKTWVAKNWKTGQELLSPLVKTHIGQGVCITSFLSVAVDKGCRINKTLHRVIQSVLQQVLVDREDFHHIACQCDHFYSTLSHLLSLTKLTKCQYEEHNSYFTPVCRYTLNNPVTLNCWALYFHNSVANIWSDFTEFRFSSIFRSQRSLQQWYNENFWFRRYQVFTNLL